MLSKLLRDFSSSDAKADIAEAYRDVDLAVKFSPGGLPVRLNGTLISALSLFTEDNPMDIKEHMEVIGADGVHVGTVDKIEGSRIKLTKKDSGEGSHKGHHHFINKALVAEVEGNKVRLSANAAVAVTMEQEASAKSI